MEQQLIRGEFTTGAATAATSGTAVDSTEWCGADVLKILRRRSLAALRAQVEPVSTAAFGRFLRRGNRWDRRTTLVSTDSLP